MGLSLVIFRSLLGSFVALRVCLDSGHLEFNFWEFLVRMLDMHIAESSGGSLMGYPCSPGPLGRGPRQPGKIILAPPVWPILPQKWPNNLVKIGLGKWYFQALWAHLDPKGRPMDPDGPIWTYMCQWPVGPCIAHTVVPNISHIFPAYPLQGGSVLSVVPECNKQHHSHSTPHLSPVCTRILTHTHTHTHIYIYMYIWLQAQPR